jgi:predicted enzyme related to lactoylglutathione lyase
MDFNSMLIGTDNKDAMVEYYTKVLGEPSYSDDSYTGWHLGSGWVNIGAHSEVHGHNPAPGRLIWNIETNDVQGEFDRMKAAGAMVVKEPYGFEGYPDAFIATLEDPDGNYFQLMTPMEM